MITISVSRIRGTVDREGAMATAGQVGRLEVVDMCRKILNQATVDCPKDTGNLQGHHRVQVNDLKTRVRGTVLNDASYASAVHDGTKRRKIVARRKKALRFVVDGEVVYARSVNHPGTKPRPWLRTAAERVAGSNGWKFTRVESSSNG